MTVAEICAAMERWAPAGYAYPWDKAGLNIGRADAKVTGVVTCLTLTRAVFHEALDRKANLIVSHHPVVWEPLKRLDMSDALTALCVEMAACGMSCYSAHTNLDVVEGGVNAVLADRLGLKDCKPLVPVPHATQLKLVTFVPESHLAAVREAVCNAGAGVIGDYTQCSFSTPGTGTFVPGADADPYSGERQHLNEEPERRFEVLLPKAVQSRVIKALYEAHPYEEPAYDLIELVNRPTGISLGLQAQLPEAVALDDFARHVCQALAAEHVRVTGAAVGHVQRVAVLGGSGGSQVHAMPVGIDVLVTGDVGYHDALAAADKGLAVIDAGHCATEKWIAPAIADRITKECPGVMVHAIVEPEPFRAIMEP